MRRRFFLLLAFLVVLSSAPVCAAAADDSLTELLAFTQQFPPETVREKIEVRHVLASRMVEALMRDQGGKFRHGIKTFYTTESKTDFEVTGTAEAVAALRERVKELDMPPQAFAHARCYRISPLSNGQWSREEVGATIDWIPLIGSQAIIGMMTDRDHARIAVAVSIGGLGLSDKNDPAPVMEGKAGLRKYVPDMLVTANYMYTEGADVIVTGKTSIRDRSTLRLLLVPSGEATKQGTAATTEAKSANPLAENGIAFFYVVEITAHIGREKPASP